MSETDRKHVPWGSCEKNFENIVIRTWPRCSSMDIVCECGKIVMGVYMNNWLKLIRCVCTTWCIFLCMQTNVRYISQCRVCCSHSLAWRMHTMRYSIVHCTHVAALHAVSTSRDECVFVHSHCGYTIMNFILRMQHVNVLPVLKHGPRSLMCVQVRNRDHQMHNKRDYVHVVICCRQICLSEFEHEHAR